MDTTEITAPDIETTAGHWLVTTTSGSVYDVDTADGVLTHTPASGDTRSALVLAGVLHCTVGDRARFLVDTDVEDVSFAVRETTGVISIIPVD